MARLQNDGSETPKCFSWRRNPRVHPCDCDQQVEVRPKRVLHIKHLNPRPRDARFEREMQMQLKYKQLGSPMRMPKVIAVRNSVADKRNSQDMLSLPSSLGSTVAHKSYTISDKQQQLLSPTNIDLAMEKVTSTSVSDSVPTRGEVQISDKILSRTASDQPALQPELGLENGGDNVNRTDSPKVPPQNPSVSSILNQNVTNTSQTTLPKHDHAPSPSNNDIETPPSEALFFIHGVGGSADVWQAQMNYFSRRGYEIIAPDLIGHGMSATPRQPKAYHFKEIASDVQHVFDKYCKRKNIVVGHSYGCSFAVVLARQRSRRVQKLVLISGGAPTPLAPQPGVFSLPSCVLHCVRPCLNCGFHKSAFHGDRQPAMAKSEAFCIPTYVLQHTMNGQDWADGDELYHQWLLCPTLLVYGAEDKLVSLQEEEHMHEVLLQSRLEIVPHASHMVMLEAPDEVNGLLQDFFAEDSSLSSTQASGSAQLSQAQLEASGERSASRLSARSGKTFKTMPGHLV